MAEVKKKSKHRRSKLYILACVSYLINLFASGLAITDVGKNQLAISPYWFVGKVFLPIYIFASSVLMVIFYYKRFIKRRHSRKKRKNQAWICLALHAVYPFYFILALYSENLIVGTVFELYMLFMIFSDAIFLTLNHTKVSKNIIGDIVAIAHNLSLAIICVGSVLILTFFIFRMGINAMHLIILQALLFFVYGLLIFEYRM